MILLLVTLSCVTTTRATLHNFLELGALPDDLSDIAAWHNGRLLNETLAALQPGDTLLLPNMTFYVMGGIFAKDLESVVLQVDGTLKFSDNMDDWPRVEDDKEPAGKVLECWALHNITNVTFTSSGIGTIDGSGDAWWGIPGIGYLQRGKNRPKLLYIKDSRDLLMENWFFLDAPRWTVDIEAVDGMEIRFCEVSARRTDEDGHGLVDLTAFNTDGFDVSGRNVWIHDVTVWNQDDCIAVKNDAWDMLFERISASGTGLVIGSISHHTVNNITFRDSYMHHTWKGIYLKFRSEGGTISNILYENILLDAPEQWAIWIGPAQQAVSSNLCNPAPCSLCWPQLEDYGAQCNMPDSLYTNITLRNITIQNPQFSYGQGVIMGSQNLPMTNITFDGVRVLGAESDQKASYHTCTGVASGVAIGDTSPVPPCFEDRTNTKLESRDL